MSRIGNNPINLPEGVEVKVTKANEVNVKGPKGELTKKIDKDIKVEVKDGQVVVSRPTEQLRHKSLHGLSRSLIHNMVVGVSKGYVKELELVGVGYKASNQGQLLDLSLGFSHNFVIALPEEISVKTETKKGQNPLITLESANKELVGQVAAKIRSLRKPEPYQGKGVLYKGEVVRRKAGKTAASTA